MSALAQLYASRGMTFGKNGSPDRANSMPAASINSTAPLVLRRKGDDEKQITPTEDKQRKAGVEAIDYTSALTMLENVNSGFADVFSRLQKCEAIKEQLVAECEKQDAAIRQYQSDLESMQNRYEESQMQNSEIAERLIAENSRACNAEHALSEANSQIEQLENICKTLHDGIYSVFGIGSPTQKVLSALEES